MVSATGGTKAVSGIPGDDRRRDVRHLVMVPGTLYRADGSEVRCVTENASEGGFEIIASRTFYRGEKVSLVLHHLDRVDLEVMRITPRGFGGRIIRTAMPRDAFMRQLKMLIGGQSGIKTSHEDDSPQGTVDQRRHARHVPNERETTIQLMGHQPMAARLIDVSQSGAAVESTLSVEKGRRVLLGRRPSSVVRVFSGGFAVIFDTPLEARRPAEAPSAMPSSRQAFL